MMNEFNITFEVTENRKGKVQKHHHPGENYYPATGQIAQFEGPLTDGLKRLDDVKKKLGIK